MLSSLQGARALLKKIETTDLINVNSYKISLKIIALNKNCCTRSSQMI